MRGHDSDHFARLRMLYGNPHPIPPDIERLRRQLRGVGDPLARRCEAVASELTAEALESLARDYSGAAQIAMKLRAALVGEAQYDA